MRSLSSFCTVLISQSVSPAPIRAGDPHLHAPSSARCDADEASAGTQDPRAHIVQIRTPATARRHATAATQRSISRTAFPAVMVSRSRRPGTGRRRCGEGVQGGLPSHRPPGAAGPVPLEYSVAWLICAVIWTAVAPARERGAAPGTPGGYGTSPQPGSIAAPWVRSREQSWFIVCYAN